MNSYDDSFLNPKKIIPDHPGKSSNFSNNYANYFSIEAGLLTPLFSSSSLNDISEYVDKSNNQSQIIEYRQNLVNNPRRKLKFSAVNKEKLFLLIKLSIYLLKFFLNLLGILISIIDDYQYTLSFEDSGHSLPILRFFLTIAYTAEYLSDINGIFKYDLFRRMFSWKYLLDLLSITLLLFSSIFFLSDNMDTDIYRITCSLEDAVLCCRIIKLQGYVKFFFYYFKNEEQHSSRVIEINEIKLEFIDSVLFFISYLFISASIILSMDHIFNFTLFAPFDSKNRLSWHNALYYQLVTMTGIGYGDISPQSFQSRLVSALLIFYLTVQFTYFLTILISLLIKNKSVNKYLPLQKGWKNHIIIIGNLLSSESLTENFLRNHYSLLYKSNRKFKTRMVFIYHKEPLQPLNNYLNYELMNEHYTLKKIRFIQNSMNDQSWMKDANLPTAKYLVCFFVTDRKGITSEEKDKIEKGILSSVSFAKSFYPKLQIFISLDSEPLLKEMKVYQGNNFHNSLSFYQLKRKLLALEVENQGASAVISMIVNGIHSIDRKEMLYLLKKKVVDQRTKLLLMNYIEGTFTRIVTITCPNILIGFECSNLNLLIYFLDFSRVASEKRMSYNEDFKYRAFLIGVKIRKKQEILVNPLKYNLNSKDRIYLIVNHDSVIERIKNITTEDLFVFTKFRNSFIEESILNEMKNLLRETMVEKRQIYSEKFEQTAPTRYFNEKHCFNLRKEIEINENRLKDHIIIIGADNLKLYDFIKRLSSLSKRSIIILSKEKIKDHELWDRVLKKRFCNVYYFYGDFLNVKSLDAVKILQAEKIFILSEPKSETFIDFSAIQTSRFISENYPEVEVFNEFMDEKSLGFLDKKIYQKDLPFQFYPLNMMGKVLFSQSVFCSLTALSFYKIGDIALKLLDPSTSFTNSYYPCNPSMSSLLINEKISFFIKNFGTLNFALMQMKWPMMGIAILKKGKKNESCQEKIDVFSWKHKILIVLPAITMELEVGDRIIMIGTDDGQQINYNEKHMKVFKKMGMLSMLNQELEQKKWSQRVDIKANITTLLKDYLELMQKIDCYSLK